MSTAEGIWPVRSGGVAAALVLVALAPLALASRAASGTSVVPHNLVAQEGGAVRVMRVAGDVLWMGLGPRLVA
jgi:hypothetical protein